MWPLPGGAGIGERLLREVARRGQASGYTHLRLTVDDGNAGGAKFYHRLGFEIPGRVCAQARRRRLPALLPSRRRPWLSPA